MAVRISLLLAAEATRDLPSVAASRVETPLGPRRRRGASRGDVVVVPVLRAGLGMLDAVLELLPDARVGHIGLQRDEMTAVASQYYSKLPRDLEQQLRADDRSDARHRRQRRRRRSTCSRSAGARDIRMICIVAAPEGIALVERHHPGRADLHAGRRSRAQRAQVHRARASATSAIGSTERV